MINSGPASPAIFQSTLPRGERRSVILVCPAAYTISIHAPARGATALNTPFGQEITISIHAPARGATQQEETATEGAGISIHAPARGATAPSLGLLLHILFQSTLPRGERPFTDNAILIAFQFQSTLPRGERLPFQQPKHTINIFQSTLPRGERRPNAVYHVLYAYFNPRSREGSDAV